MEITQLKRRQFKQGRKPVFVVGGRSKTSDLPFER